MFPILITKFYGNLSIVGVPTNPTPNPFSEMSGMEILSLNRINLMEVCHVLLNLLSFMHISGDQEYY